MENFSGCSENKTTSENSVRLGKDAISLLITMCNGNGIMNVSTSLDSYMVSVDDDAFVDCSSLDNRSVAKWKDAIQKLEYYDLLETNNNALYRVTQNGYKAAEDLEQQIGEYKVKCSMCHYHGTSDKKDECPICESVLDSKLIVLEEIRKNPHISRKALSEITECSKNSVNRILKELVDRGLIERIGSEKTGYWKCKK